MGRCAGQHRPTRASCYYTKVMGHPVPKTTVQKFCGKYKQKLEVRRKHHDLIFLIFLSRKK